MSNSLGSIFRLFVLYLIWFVGLLCNSIEAHENLYIAHFPKHMRVNKQTTDLSLSRLPWLSSSVLGLSTYNKETHWNGLIAGSPFHRPEANLVVLLDNFIDGLHVDLNAPSFAIKKTKSPVNFNDVEADLKALYEDSVFLDIRSEQKFVSIWTDSSELFGEIPTTLKQAEALLRGSSSVLQGLNKIDLGDLNLTNHADLYFLSEMQIIKEFGNALEKHREELQNNIPDLFQITVSSFKAVADEHGLDSVSMHNAMTVLRIVLYNLQNSMEHVYGDNYVYEVITLNGETVRASRKRRQAADPKEPKADAGKASSAADINLADDVDAMFPVVFNIFLWTSIAIVLALYAICYALWTMDPGRDSIIYRMTSQRIKME